MFDYRIITSYLIAFLSGISTAHGGVIIGLTQANQLVSFDSFSPGNASSPVLVVGLLPGDSLVGIDYRPSTGVLYAVARNSSTGRLYTLDAFTGMATPAATIDQPLAGSFFGIDFNPVADRLRLVSDSGQSLRIDVGTGVTTVDGSLAFAAGDVNSGTGPLVVASAYTNSLPGATSTTLFGLDLTTQSLVVQNPPNVGTLNTIGGLSTFGFAEASFDIEPGTNVAYAVLNGFELSTINLTSGIASFVGEIGSSSNIVGIAVSPVGIPEPTAVFLVASMLMISACRRNRPRL